MFKTPIIVPIFVLLISIYLVFAPVIDNPRYEYLAAIGIVLLGLVFYVPFVHFKLELPYFGKKKKRLRYNKLLIFDILRLCDKIYSKPT